MRQKQSYFINGMGMISPQKTFERDIFLTEITEYDKNVLTCVVPNFKDYINPIQMRRLSRMLRIGLSSAVICLRESNVQMPDGIITATGYGFLDETAKFLRELLEQGERQLTPTYFMQGTSNALAGLVALTIKCMGYNNTYVSKGFAFENAMIDAMMQLNEKPEANLLVGSYDEAAEVQYNASIRASHFKTEHIKNLSVFNTNTKGSIQGEGSGFFMLSGKSAPSSWCILTDMQMVYKPAPGELENSLNSFLADNNVSLDKVDLIISGASGDVQHDGYLNAFIDNHFSETMKTRFKHLSGEYSTATSFALWLGASVLKRQQVPEIIKPQPGQQSDNLDTVLIINQYMGKSFTFILLAKIDRP